MAFCEKCGGQITEEMKFCEKCGAPLAQVASEAAPEAAPAPVPAVEAEPAPVVENADVQVDVQPSAAQSVSVNGLINTVKAHLPAKLTTPGDKTLHWIGFGSLAALAVTYLICFFVFMNEICLPVGLGATFDGANLFGGLGVDGANAVWIVVYFILNLFPTYFAVKSFKYESCKKCAIIVAAFSFILTIFSLIVWGICDIESIDGANSMAWYFLNDALSAAWYLKFILPLTAIFGFGMDYTINKKD